MTDFFTKQSLTDLDSIVAAFESAGHHVTPEQAKYLMGIMQLYSDVEKKQLFEKISEYINDFIKTNNIFLSLMFKKQDIFHQLVSDYSELSFNKSCSPGDHWLKRNDTLFKIKGEDSKTIDRLISSPETKDAFFYLLFSNPNVEISNLVIQRLLENGYNRRTSVVDPRYVLEQLRESRNRPEEKKPQPIVPTINKMQKALVSAYIYYYFEDINELVSSVETIKAFNLIFSATVSEEDKAIFETNGKWESINILRDLLSHPEPHKLLRLECKNDHTAVCITKKALVDFIRSLIEQQIQMIIKEEKSATKVQKAFRHYSFYQKQKNHGQKSPESAHNNNTQSDPRHPKNFMGV